MSSRWWVRFYTDSMDDPRPVTHPRPFDWWCTGYTTEQAIVCGVVDAPDEDAALHIVTTGWPEVRALDFCNPRPSDWTPPADRFPPYAR